MANRFKGLGGHALSFVGGASISTGFLLKYSQEINDFNEQLYDLTGINIERGSIKTVAGRHGHEIEPVVSSSMDTVSPMLPIVKFRPNENMEICFDTRTKNPLYVLETLEAISTEKNRLLSGRRGGGGRKSMSFYEEKSLPSHLRSRNSYYRNSGYDRGHMIPAADFQDNGLCKDTFTLSNVSPQHKSLNRKHWAKLENMARKITEKIHKDDRSNNNGKERSTIVISGPLWIPNERVKGSFGQDNQKEFYRYNYFAFGDPPSVISIPTHFFKIIAVLSTDRRKDGIEKAEVDHTRIENCAAFVLPNGELPEDASPVDFLVRLQDLEAVSGMQFFEGGSETKAAVTSTEKQILDLLTEEILRKKQHGFKTSPIRLLLGNSGSSHSVNNGKDSGNMSFLENVEGPTKSYRSTKQQKNLRKEHDKIIKSGRHFDHLCNKHKCF